MLGDGKLRTRVGDARVLEILSAVVEDEVNASKLLEGLQEATGYCTLPNIAAKAIEISGFSQ